MVSYAQNREDVLLDRVFPRGKPGFYIDVGANEPVRNSVTKHFYDLGWHGINIEPVVEPFEQLREHRARDVNLNVALSDEEGELVLFEFPSDFSTASTLSEEHAARHQSAGLPYVERKVPTMTLAQVCERHVDGAIDFLSIDVEGHEGEVLRGADWKRWRPRIVLVEATEPRTLTTVEAGGVSIPSHERWEHILLEAGYLFAAFDGLNRYYVRSEDADLAPILAVPVNVSDSYMPYEHAKQLEDLRWHLHTHAEKLGEVARREAAARAVNQSLAHALHGLASELQMLRAHYERLERALTNTRSQYESLREQVTAAQWAADEILAKADEARAEAEAAVAAQAPAGQLEGVGPASLSVARRLTALSSRHPRAASSVKTALRAARKVKRAVAGR